MPGPFSPNPFIAEIATPGVPNDPGTGFRQDSGNRNARSAGIPPLPPKQFYATREGTGLRFTIVDRGAKQTANGQLSSSMNYVIYFAANVDVTTQDGVNAGFARAVICMAPIVAPRKEDAQATGYLTDPKYQSGAFYCVGVSGLGENSRPTSPVIMLDGIVDNTIPADVTRFDASESGEVHEGVVFSAVSFECLAPTPLGSFAALQLYFDNYPVLGQEQEGPSIRYNGPPGGTISGKVILPVGRRPGIGIITISGTSVTVAGGNLFTQAQPGDVLEVLGTRAGILIVNSATSATISPAWTGKTVTSVTDWTIISLCIIRAVAVSKGGTRRGDINDSPSVQVLMDGQLSAPLAPLGLVLTTMGNAIRIEFPQINGTSIDHYNLYRSTGSTNSGIGGGDTKLLKAIPQDAATVSTLSLVQYDDAAFTVLQKEQQQIFRYYVTAVNTRGDESSATTDIAACGLDGNGDQSPTAPSRAIAENRFWNGYIAGTALNTVDSVDTSQDGPMGFALPTGHYRWTGAQSGGGVRPGHQTTTAVVLAIPPGLQGNSSLIQKIGAWDNVAAERRIDKGQAYCLSFYAQTTGGSPNGQIICQVAQYNGDPPQYPGGTGAFQGQAPYMERFVGDSIGFLDLDFTIPGSEIVSDFARYYVIFRPDKSLTTTDIIVAISYQTLPGVPSNGVNVLITKAMFGPGEDLAAWTPNMGNVTQQFPPPTGGGGIPSIYQDRTRGRFPIATLP